MNEALGWLLGLKNVKSIDEIDPSLAAPWVAGGTFWIFFALAGAAGCGAGVLRQIPASRLAGRAARLGPVPRSAAGLAAADPGRPGAARVADRRQAAAVVSGVRRHRQHGDRGRVSGGPASGVGQGHGLATEGRGREEKAVPRGLPASVADQRAKQPAVAADGRQAVSRRGLPVRREHDQPAAKAGGTAWRGRHAGPETRRGAADDQRPSDGPGRGPERHVAAVRRRQSGGRGRVQRFRPELRPRARRRPRRFRGFAGRQTGRADLYGGPRRDRSDGLGGRPPDRSENETRRADQRAGQTAAKRLAGSLGDRHGDGPQAERRVWRYRSRRTPDRPEDGELDDEPGNRRVPLHARRRRTLRIRRRGGPPGRRDRRREQPGDARGEHHRRLSCG